MKKTSKMTAFLLAASMALSAASVTAFAEEPATPAVQDNATISGGWSVNDGAVAMSKNPDAKAAFKKATAGLTGVNYKPIAVLGSQVVAGTNYAILCRPTAVYPDAQPEIKIMYVYADLMGNAEIIGFQTIIGAQLMGGFTANSGKLAVQNNKTVYDTYKKAMKGLTGVSYTPAAYLGSQVVAGTNYMVLCRSKGVYPGARYEWSLVTVNKDLNGNASVVSIETLDLGYMDDETEDENAENEVMVGIANPWTAYETVEEAAKAAGVEFKAPEKLGKHTIAYIQSMKGLVDVRYTKNDNTITVRKGTGTDDISGDYNEYKSVSQKEINGYSVTLKGNGKGVKAAVWTDGKNSFAVLSDRLLTEKFMESIICSVC